VVDEDAVGRIEKRALKQMKLNPKTMQVITMQVIRKRMNTRLLANPFLRNVAGVAVQVQMA